MLEASDLQYLKRSQTRGARIRAWVLVILACVFIVGGILNIRLGAKRTVFRSFFLRVE
jgi:apolipoprotein N-acyltransferase